MDNDRLDRFLEAQARNFADALAELRAGEKRSHWMWYVFPQLAGLGLSPTAQFYGIASQGEARAYLAHPILGPRLLETTRAVLGHPGRSLHAIFGSPDCMKFCSSMTLFAHAAPTEPLFRQALATFCAGTPCPRTLELLAGDAR